jgi:hypothetical protein
VHVNSRKVIRGGHVLVGGVPGRGGGGRGEKSC